MTTIWKFPLEVTDEQFIKMPKSSMAMTVQVQNDVPCLWAMIDKLDALYEPYHAFCIKTVGTGHDFDFINDFNFTYLGTYQLFDGNFVGHVFIKNP